MLTILQAHTKCFAYIASLHSHNLHFILTAMKYRKIHFSKMHDIY